MRIRYIAFFWAGLVGVALAGGFGLHLLMVLLKPGLKPLPYFGFASRDFYIATDDTGVEIHHYLYLYGLLGMGDRLKNADLLFLGTSHPEIGLSARIFSDKLSAVAGRPVRVYNVGLGWAEGWGFISKVLTRNHVQNKAVLIDLYNPLGDSASAWGTEVEAAGPMKAAIKVGNVWFSLMEREIFYPIIPRIMLVFDNSPMAVDLRPFVEGGLNYRNWNNGDVHMIWHCYMGTLYGEGIDNGTKLTSDPMAPLPGTQLPELAQQLIRRNHLRPILTLIPWVGFDGKEAARVAAASGFPYLPLQPDTLSSFDGGSHLSTPSRDLASRELLREAEAQNPWPTLLGPGYQAKPASPPR